MTGTYSNKSKEEWDKKEENRRLAKQAVYNPSFGGDTRAYAKLQPTSMLGGDQPKTPGFDIGKLITGDDLQKNLDNINYAKDFAQQPYAPGQQQVMVDGAPVANPDLGKEYKDLGPSISNQFAENVQKDAGSLLSTAVGEKALEKGGEQVLGKVAGAAGTAMAAKGMYDMATTGEGATGDTTTDVASSAMSGAMSGAAFGAPGMAVGAVLGGIAGGLGSNAARKNQNAKIEGEKFEKQALIAEKKMARNSKIFGDMKADFEKALRTPRRTM